MRAKNGEPSAHRLQFPAGRSNFEIIVAGHLDEHWAGLLGNLKIIHELDGNTRLLGEIPDQAALHGILAQIRDLDLPLISLRQLTPQRVDHH
jgi:hypothetical protein